MTAPEPSLQLHLAVRAGFITQGTTLAQWSRKHGFTASNVRAALMGSWDGEKGREVRAKAIAAAGVAPIDLPTSSLSPFDQVLLRLKQALGFTKDHEVAAALGMGKAAFSLRRKRGTFPEDKLRVLAQKKPSLGLDVSYILTGSRR